MTRPFNTDLECVDPAVGDRLSDLRDEALDESDRRLLEAHQAVCAHCRLTLDLERGFAEGLGNASLDSDGPRVVGTMGRRVWTGWAAVAAAAACLVLMLGLPPRSTGPEVNGRGSGAPGFVAPVEGQVIGVGDLDLSWDAVPGAESYRLRVSELADGTIWNGSSQDTHLRVPAESGLVMDKEYRALLSTVPEDLLPPGGLSVSFRTGSRKDILSHRALNAQPASYVFALAGLILGGAFLARRRS